MQHRGRVSYVKKRLAKRSLPAAFLEIFGWILFFTCMGVGVKGQGQAGLNVGAAGFCSFLLGLVGLVYAVRSMAEKERNYILARICIGAGILLSIIWLVIILIGLRG